MTYSSIALTLGKNGLCVCPDFLSSSGLINTRNDLEVIQNLAPFTRAGTGQGDGQEVRDLVRRDEIHWLDRAHPSSVQVLLWRKLDALKQAINRKLFLGLTDFEGHYAVYPKGGFYKRHLDCFKNDDARVVSFVLYLNHDWQPSDGGQLRVYNNKDETHVDVNPVGGTIVCFLSKESEHEVLPSHASRFSFAGWFTSRKPFS